MPKESAWIDPRIVEEMIDCSKMHDPAKRRTRYYIRLYADHLESRGVPFEDAGADDVQLFYDALLESYASSTASKALGAVKRLHRWVESGEIERVGKDYVNPSRTAGDGVRKALSPAEARKVMSACESKRDAALIGLMMEAALKSGEVGRANVGDVTFLEDCAVMLVTATAVRPESVLRIPSSPAAKLKKYLENRNPRSSAEPLFTSESTRTMGARLSDRSIRESVQIIFSRAGIPGKAGDYDLRKTALLLAREVGANDEDLVRFARLRSMSTIKDVDNQYRYASDSPQERIAQALKGSVPGRMSCIAKVSEIRRKLDGFAEDDLLVVAIDESGSLIFETLAQRQVTAPDRGSR